MTHNIYEFLYIIIGSSISHAILVISLVYFIYNLVILKENQKKIVIAFLDYMKPLTNKDENENNKNQNPTLAKILNLNIIEKINESIKKDIDNEISHIKEKADQVAENNKIYNMKYTNAIAITLISMSIVFFGFLLFYYMKYNSSINFMDSITEIILTIVIAFILIISYEYLFATYFIFNYIDYNFDKIFTESILRKLTPTPSPTL
jgi:hypothetical protein